MDERNDKNKKLMPKKATGPGLHSAVVLSGVHDPNASLLSVILTGVIHAMPDARFGGADSFVRSHSFIGSIVVTIVNFANRFDTQMIFTMEGSRLVVFTSGTGITIDVRIRGDSN